LRLEARAGIELPKHARGDGQAGDHEPTFGDEGGDGGTVGSGTQQAAGNVLRRAILGQRAAHLL
jgi:hypothetical protein